MNKPCYHGGEINECNDCEEGGWVNCHLGKPILDEKKAKLAKAREISKDIWLAIYLDIHCETNTRALKSVITKTIKKHL